MQLLSEVDKFAVIVTAPGKDVDFVFAILRSREGSVRGPRNRLAHCTLIPYWSNRLGKKKLHAYQVSRRGGELWCEDRGERVTMSGKGALFLEGTIYF